MGLWNREGLNPFVVCDDDYEEDDYEEEYDNNEHFHYDNSNPVVWKQSDTIGCFFALIFLVGTIILALNWH